MRLLLLEVVRYAFAALALIAGSVSIAADKPNIILIMADDVSWEAFGCYGAEDYRTPELDALAEKGLRFSHCYSTPICTTSRVQLMTGKYNFRNYTHFGYLSPDEKTFGNLLQAAGYKTAIAGKWQLNGLYNTLDRNQDKRRPYDAGFDEYMLWQLTKGKGQGGGERFWSPPLEHNGRMETSAENADKYGPDLLCDFICDFMERSKDDPFFVYYPMVLVHDPFVPTPDTIDAGGAPGSADRSQAANKANKSTKKENFVAMVQYMDKIVGRIVDKVEQLGELENTIIIFTADNGTNVSITSGWNGMQIRGGKAGMTDMGTHVPLIAYWKGHTPDGKVIDDLVDFTDFYPMVAEAAGIELGSGDPTDGRSFYPQLNGKPGTPRDWVFCHYQCYWNKKPGQFVRNQTHKLYADGRFFNVPIDLKEAADLNGTELSPDATEIYKSLRPILDDSPPAPTEIKDKSATERPVYPDWKNLHEIDD